MLTLTLHTPPPVPVELAGVVPDRIHAMNLGDISHLPVLCGNRTEPLGTYFSVAGDPSDAAVRIDGDCSRVKRIGAGMAAGTMTVAGLAGMHAGAGMTGGTLTIDGDAGDWLAAELRGGTVRVRGDAGDQCAAAYRGSRHGVRGGVVIVHGGVGAEAGLLMRRGILVVGGCTGEFAGASMIAGTLVAAAVGRHAGAGMKRGTLVVGREPNWPPGFRFSCVYEPAYMGLLAAWLRELDAPPPAGLGTRPVRCYRGDIIHGGDGEVLVG